MWEGLFLPDDPLAILKPRWSLPESQLSVVVETILERGWEAAAAIYEQKRTETKRRWESITGAGRYGSKKAVTWVPPNWRAELEGAAETDLQAAAVDLRDRIQAMGVSQTIEQAKIDEAKELLATKVPQAETEYEEATKSFTDKQNVVIDVSERLDASLQGQRNDKTELARAKEILQAAPQSKCPGCGIGLKVSGREVGMWIAPSQNEILNAGKKAEELEKRIRDGQDNVRLLSDSAKAAQHELDDARLDLGVKRGQLALLKEQTVYANMEPSQSDEAARARLELQLEEANKSLIAYQQWTNATREHDNIVELDAVCTLSLIHI